MLGANGIVGGSMGIVCGAAWAFKRRGQDHAAICFFGEGAANEGIFHESLNMAAIWKLPVVFLCENNQYGMSMSVKKATAVENISDRAAAYGMPASRSPAPTSTRSTMPPPPPSNGRARGRGRRSWRRSRTATSATPRATRTSTAPARRSRPGANATR
jgi:hypothetical protein